jgi:hypothetical protein
LTASLAASAFGLDISGYSAGRTALAYAERSSADAITITIYGNHPMAVQADGATPLLGIATAERELLEWCIEQAPLYIDAPLHLRALPAPADARYVFELTRSPADYALGALPPLADRIGAPVARLLYLMRMPPTDLRELIGTRIFETYPAEALRNLALPSTGYKNQSATMRDGIWTGEGLAEICTGIKLRADDGLSIDDDEVDALLCALTGVAGSDGRLAGEPLAAELTARIQRRIPDWQPIGDVAPPGFVLLGRLPAEGIHLRREVWAEVC